MCTVVEISCDQSKHAEHWESLYVAYTPAFISVSVDLLPLQVDKGIQAEGLEPTLIEASMANYS